MNIIEVRKKEAPKTHIAFMVTNENSSFGRQLLKSNVEAFLQAYYTPKEGEKYAVSMGDNSSVIISTKDASGDYRRANIRPGGCIVLPLDGGDEISAYESATSFGSVFTVE